MTFAFVLLTVIPGVLGGLVVVLLLEQHIKGIRIFRTAFALPFAFSVASASVIFATIYNPAIGLANGLLGRFGVDRIGWLTDPSWALISVAITTVWMSIGYNVLVLSAGHRRDPDRDQRGGHPGRRRRLARGPVHHRCRCSARSCSSWS